MLLKATHEGELMIGRVKVACAVLDDGTRVLSCEDLLKIIGMPGGMAKMPTASAGPSPKGLPRRISYQGRDGLMNGFNAMDFSSLLSGNPIALVDAATSYRASAGNEFTKIVKSLLSVPPPKGKSRE